VVILGSRFLAGASVAFGTVASPKVTFVGSTELKAVAPPQPAGTVDVTATTIGGTSAISAADRYTYGPPTVTGVSPIAGPTSGANTVTINGSDFVRGASVKFGATASASVTLVSATQLHAVAPAHAAGSIDVTVTTGGGTSGTSSSDQYTYDLKPTVTGLNPKTGSTSGGNTVTITGTGFVQGASVKFGTSASATVGFVSATQLTATAPPHAAGVIYVTVTTPGGTSAAVTAAAYTYRASATSALSGWTSSRLHAGFGA
jgi:hypothetical protein